jgi:GT2 family glycosyltransferase
MSVVIVAYNCETALRRCVQALESSKDRERMEVLVVDAGSRDGCPRIDSEFPKVTVLRLPRNFGKTRARNIAVRTAQAEIVLFLDPHVELQPDALAAMASALESREDATAVFPALDDEAGQPVALAFRLPSAAQLAEASLRGTSLPRAELENGAAEAVDEWALAVRKTFIGGMNYLDEKRFSEHWSLLEVCWQVRNAGKKIVLAAEARGTLHSPTKLALDETTYAADRVSGAAAYIGKHDGMGAGISFKVKCFFASLGSLRVSLAMSILSGTRLDPTQ